MHHRLQWSSSPLSGRSLGLPGASLGDWLCCKPGMEASDSPLSRLPSRAGVLESSTSDCGLASPDSCSFLCPTTAMFNQSMWNLIPADTASGCCGAVVCSSPLAVSGHVTSCMLARDGIEWATHMQPWPMMLTLELNL